MLATRLILDLIDKVQKQSSLIVSGPRQRIALGFACHDPTSGSWRHCFFYLVHCREHGCSIKIDFLRGCCRFTSSLTVTGRIKYHENSTKCCRDPSHGMLHMISVHK